MPRQRGWDVVIRVGDDGAPETFTEVAGLKARRIELGATLVDATHNRSADAWREILDRSGTRSIDVVGSGVFTNAESDARMRMACVEGRTPNFELVIGSFGTLRGPFAVQQLVYGGEPDDEASFSIRLASAGPLNFDSNP